MLAPDEAMSPEDRAEGAELEPADEQFRIIGADAVEAAGVGSPMRNTSHADLQARANLQLQTGECRIDVARPGGGAKPLHAWSARTAQQVWTLVRTVGCLAFGEGLLAKQVVAIVQDARGPCMQRRRCRWALTAIQPPAGDTKISQLLMRAPPPRPRFRAREVDQSLALFIDHR